MQTDKSFEEMSSAEKRVQIARDVLAQLESKRLIASTGEWLINSNRTVKGSFYSKEDYIDNLEFQEVLKRTEKCKGCALGGIFMSAVERANNLKLQELDPDFGIYITGIPRKSDIFCYLNRYFTHEQLVLIEFAFEMGNGVCYIEDDMLRIRALNLFLGEYGNARNAEFRMKYIMQNIVDNNGDFVL